MEIEGVAKYLVRNGKEILIEPTSEDWKSILLFFYSNCLGALLFQRDLIPFHVSGVLDPDGKVWLFAAPSQTGKSTTALKLKEKGFEIFTDDTALIYVREGKCWSIPSYPMIRAWKNTLDKQSVFQPEEATQIRSEIDKYGIFFHEHFQDIPREVKGIIFLEEEGQEIQIRKIGVMEALPLLGNNIYRGYWVEGMKKQIIQFEVLTSIIRYTNFWKAIRPKNQDSFNSFTDEIIDQILVKG
ncbi:hypothetical protein E4S40_01675 [Algoriphagus kandeliae]|uniref:Serine kinase n=1 Tax=Algoriphagus kandeliae TaxID=2562278 RepID=A0A4Y9QY34_9BACT|nr:hypothetical protein [Algoriphagus kandeliae]TFV97391.1 hypothetical protein E4S40_01675 [Algoriphagus kandeliae]